ncbi:MAG: phosphatase PAP2 family protein [Clostridia bacterium]|nr:phosphatase PAP2 family protein [Clostridia bacterium]
MKKETYINLMEYIRKRKILTMLIRILYTFLPVIMMVAYPFIVLLNAFDKIDHSFILSIVVPAVTLLGVIVMRKLINKPRPYEKYGVSSLILKRKSGKSFPSNHCACGFVIAMSGFTVSTILGFMLLPVAILIALTRIFSGVHFISDTVAGSLIGIIAGLIFIFI